MPISWIDRLPKWQDLRVKGQNVGLPRWMEKKPLGGSAHVVVPAAFGINDNTRNSKISLKVPCLCSLLETCPRPRASRQYTDVLRHRLRLVCLPRSQVKFCHLMARSTPILRNRPYLAGEILWAQGSRNPAPSA